MNLLGNYSSIGEDIETSIARGEGLFSTRRNVEGRQMVLGS